MQHTNTLPELKRKHVKLEESEQHAKFKACKEVENKTKDPEHVFAFTEYIDDFTILIYACNTNLDSGKSVFSRVYIVHQPCAME